MRSFVEDVQSNGFKPVFESVKQGASDAVGFLTDGSRLQNAVGRFTARVNNALQALPRMAQAFMQGLNDRLYGINRQQDEQKGTASESRYWKEITGLSKNQFLYALKKERDQILLLGAISSEGIDLNAVRATDGPGSESNALAKLRLSDLVRGNFGGFYELRRSLVRRTIHWIVDGPAFADGKLGKSLKSGTSWMKDRLASNQVILAAWVVKFHESCVAGETFGQIYKDNDSLKQRYFSPEGSGRSYTEQHDAYRQTILQQYTNYTLLTAGLLFFCLLIRLRTKKALKQNEQATVEIDEMNNNNGHIDTTEHQIRKLQLEVEKLKLER